MSCGMYTSDTPGKRLEFAAPDPAQFDCPLFRSDAAHLDVDRRGRALIQHGIHQAAGLEISAQFRNLACAIRWRTSPIYTKLLTL